MPIKRVFFMSLQVSRGHPDGWSPSMIEFIKDALNSDVGNIHVCVCEACISKAMKCKDKVVEK